MEEYFRDHWHIGPKYPQVKILKIWPMVAPQKDRSQVLTRREYFTSDLYANDPESFPPGFFTYFGCPTAENYKSVFLTVMRPNGAFDQCATKGWVRFFWGATMGQIFKILTRRDFGPLHQWSRKFPSGIFYPFWAPHGQKLRISLFDYCAIRKSSKIRFKWRVHLIPIWLVYGILAKLTNLKYGWNTDFWKFHLATLLQLQESRYRTLPDAIRDVKLHTTTCGCDWFCPLLIASELIASVHIISFVFMYYNLCPWSSWTVNSDKKLNVNKSCVTSRKTAFRKICKVFCQFSRCYKFW